MANYGPEWQLWIWIAVVAGLLLAAVVVAATGRPRLEAVPPQHIAAATLIGLFTWNLVQQLPSMYFTVTGMYAGIDQAPNKGLHQAFVALSSLLVVAGVLAVAGMLRRQPWALVLGIAVCVASIGGNLISIGTLFGSVGGLDNFGPDFQWYIVSILLQPVPAIVGLALLAWPFVRPPDRSLRAEVGPDRRRDDGLVEADSEEAVGIEWPDWSAPPSDQR